MPGFIKGTLFGAALAVASLVGYAYGNQYADEPIDSDYILQQCSVRVGYGSPSYSGQCRFNQVMVGYRQDFILCSDVIVDCP